MKNIKEETVKTSKPNRTEDIRRRCGDKLRMNNLCFSYSSLCSRAYLACMRDNFRGIELMRSLRDEFFSSSLSVCVIEIWSGGCESKTNYTRIIVLS